MKPTPLVLDTQEVGFRIGRWVQYYDNGWRHGELREICAEEGWAILKHPLLGDVKVLLEDIREEL